MTSRAIMTRIQLEALPNYEHTMPTRPSLGFQWRCPALDDDGHRIWGVAKVVAVDVTADDRTARVQWQAVNLVDCTACEVGRPDIRKAIEQLASKPKKIRKTLLHFKEFEPIEMGVATRLSEMELLCEIKTEQWILTRLGSDVRDALREYARRDEADTQARQIVLQWLNDRTGPESTELRDAMGRMYFNLSQATKR